MNMAHKRGKLSKLIKGVAKATAAILLTTTVMISCKSEKEKEPIAKAMEQIDSLFTERYKPLDTLFAEPGGAVLIMKKDSVLFDKGYGHYDIARRYKIDGNTSFNIASCSKQFTAAAILLMDDEGMLNINNSIYDISPEILPYLPAKKEPFTKITPAHLMSHSSGIADLRPRTDMNFMLYCTDMQSIEYIKKLEQLNFEPGTEYEYINPTYQLLYLVIEKLSGKSFDEYMKERIFTPARMFSTHYFSANGEYAIPNMAHGYILDTPEDEKASTDSDKPQGAASVAATTKAAQNSDKAANSSKGPTPKFKECDYGEETFFATKADGGIYCSTRQYANWIKALRDNKVITQRQKDKAWSFVNKVSGSKFSNYQNRENTYYGLGWFLELQQGYPLKVYHTGDNGGFQIYGGYFPSADVAVIVFENRNDKDRWSMVQQIDKILQQANLLED